MHLSNAIASLAVASVVLATPIDVQRRADDCGAYHPVVQTVWVKNDAAEASSSNGPTSVQPAPVPIESALAPIVQAGLSNNPASASLSNGPSGVKPASMSTQTVPASGIQSSQGISRKSTVPPTLLDTATVAATAGVSLQTVTSTSTVTSFAVGSTTVSGKASQVTSTILSTKVITITVTPSATSSQRSSIQPGAVTQDAFTMSVSASSAVATTLTSAHTTVVNGGTTITFLSTITTNLMGNTQKLQTAPTLTTAGSSQIPPYSAGNKSTIAASGRTTSSVASSATLTDLTSTHLTLTQATSTLAVATTKPTTTVQTADQTSTLASAIASSIVATATPSSFPHANADDPFYQTNFTAAHNTYRKRHQANNLVWDADLANSALIQGEGCVWAHNTSINGGGYGQNIYAVTVAPSTPNTPNTNLVNPQLVVDGWYNEVVDYHSYGLPNPTNDTPGKVTGHFTQVVWRASTRLGCATVRCPSLKGAFNGITADYVVCNYKAPGNFGGQYADNVKPPTS